MDDLVPELPPLPHGDDAGRRERVAAKLADLVRDDDGVSALDGLRDADVVAGPHDASGVRPGDPSDGSSRVEPVRSVPVAPLPIAPSQPVVPFEPVVPAGLVVLAAYPSAGGRVRAGGLRWVAAAAVLVLVAGVAVALAGSRQDHDAGPNVPTLAELAVRLGREPDRPLILGEYWYQESRTLESSATDEVVTMWVEQRKWIAVDGTGRGTGAAVSVRADGSEVVEDLPNSEGDFTVPGSMAFLGSYSYKQLRALPDEPGALRDEISRSRGVQTGDVPYLFAELARAEVVAPGTRRAALEVLIDLGGEVVAHPDVGSGSGGSSVVTVAGEGRDGAWTVLVDASTGVPTAMYLGYGSGPDGRADLATAVTAVEFGRQAVTTSTAG